MLDRNRTADALDLWRAGERNVTRRTLTLDWRDDYEAAVDAALAHLRRSTTMVELVTAYYDLDDDTYWRRAQQLIMAAIGGSSGQRE